MTTLTGRRALSDLEQLVESPILWDELRPLMLSKIGPRLRESFLIGAELARQQRPVRAKDDMDILPFDWEAVNAAADRVVAEYSDAWWRQFSASTQRSLRAAIVRARDQGLGVAAVERDIADLFGERRARLIAVSETTTLIGRGAQETYREAGFGSWIWRTVRDTAVDPICVMLSRESDPRHGGTPFPMSRPFERAHPGCRCWPVPYGDPTAIAA